MKSKKVEESQKRVEEAQNELLKTIEELTKIREKEKTLFIRSKRELKKLVG